MKKQNESLDTLKQRLGKLRPDPVSPECMEKLCACIPAQKVAFRLSHHDFKWLMAIAATVLLSGVAAVWSINHNNGIRHEVAQKNVLHKGQPLDTSMVITSSDQYFVGARKVGIWPGSDGRAYRVVQGLSMNQTIFQDSVRQTELKMIEPQQRVLLMAMATQ